MRFLRNLWLRWKSLKLPWRRTFLVGMLMLRAKTGESRLLMILGQDLVGNTFWEFKDHLNANRLRRIVRYNPQAHYADVKISRELTYPLQILDC